MELPFTVVFEPPSQSELRAILRMRGLWVAGSIIALAIGTLFLVPTLFRGDAVASLELVPLDITSRPADAQVWLDGHPSGRTPASLLVEPGNHSVLLKASDALDGQYTLPVGTSGAALNAVLWRRQPLLTRLRPTLPGAALTDVRFLSDGQLGLSIAIPASKELQAWRLEPTSGGLDVLLGQASGTRLAIAADGERVAYTGFEIGPTSSPPDANMLWLVERGQSTPSNGWRAPVAPGERLVDASWSPRDDRLLVVSSAQDRGGTPRSRVWLVDAADLSAREAVTLPSDVVPGSAIWSPDGAHVAFVAHAGGVSALCLLDADGAFRYLADLDLASEAPLRYLSATWSADSQRLMFVAPHQHPMAAASGWLQPPPARHAVYVADVSGPGLEAIGDTTLDAATWREDGQILVLGRASNDGPLGLRLLSAAAGAASLVELPLKPAPGYAAVWDISHARLLLVNPVSTGSVDYWLASLGAEYRLVNVRRFAPLLATLLLTAAAQTAVAQTSQPPVPGSGLNDLLANPGEWMTVMFNAALVGLGRRTTDDAVGFMTWLLGNGNIISQTPPALSYDSQVVGRLWSTVRWVADAGLAVVTVWSGVNLMLHPHIRAPYHGALELLPRLMLSGVLVNTSLHWGHFVIDLNNALCREIGSAPMPAWDAALQASEGPPLLNLIAMVVYLVMGLLLLGQMLMRLALLDTLLVVAPLALLCWVLPQTYSWARLWFSTLFATVFVQSIQVVVLQLGSELIRHLPTVLQSFGSTSVDAGRTWLVTLLLGVAVLQLARKVPRLMPGYPGGGGGGVVAGASSLGTVRQVAALIRPAAARGGK